MGISAREFKMQLDNLEEYSSYFNKKEMKFVKDMLDEDEVIQVLTRGYYKTTMWFIVVTQQRFMLLHKQKRRDIEVKEYFINDISEIIFNKKLMFGEVTLNINLESIKLSNMIVKEAKDLVEVVNDILDNDYYHYIEEDNDNENDHVGNGINNNNVNKIEINKHEDILRYEGYIDVLERLDDLFKKEIISETEYFEQKKSVLSKMRDI